MNRLILNRLSAARTLILNHHANHHALTRTTSPSPFSSSNILRTLTTTPSSPSQSPKNSNVPATPTSEKVSEQSSVTADASTVSSPPTTQPPTDVSATVDVTTAASDASSTAFSSIFRWGRSSASSASTSSATATTTPPIDAITDQATGQVVDVATTAATSSSSTMSEILLTPAMSVLNGTHDLTGLPWWASIALATVAIRTALLPFTLMTLRNSATMQALKEDIAYRREAVMEAARSGDRLLANSRQTEMTKFMQDAGVAPLRVLIGPLVQFPVFISFFVSIRRLAVSDPTFTTGGLAWFHDLSVMDPIYVLPVICGATLLGMTELGGDSGSTSNTPQMRMVMRFMSAVSIPMTYWFPTAVFCYWIPNNLISMSLGVVMRVPAMRKRVGLLIDPAKIPGTRAHRALMARTVMSTTAQNSDAASAAASYVVSNKTAAKIASSAQLKATDVVKPVLLKSRPVKRSGKAKARSS